MESRIYFRKYEFGDLLEILSKKFIEKYKYQDIRESNIDYETTWTLCDDNEVLGCAGFKKYWDGVYEVWLHPKTLEIFEKHKILIIKKIKKEINNFKFNRIHAPVHIMTKNHNHLMKLLGFNYEGILHRYQPDGNDAVMYSMVR